MSSCIETEKEVVAQDYIPGHAYLCTFKEGMGVVGGKSFIGIRELDYFAMIGKVFYDMHNIKFTADYFSKIVPVEKLDVANYLMWMFSCE